MKLLLVALICFGILRYFGTLTRIRGPFLAHIARTLLLSVVCVELLFTKLDILFYLLYYLGMKLV